MFNNTEEQDRAMIRAVADALRKEMGRQIDLDNLAVAAIMAMVSWARAHPAPRWFNDNDNDNGREKH